MAVVGSARRYAEAAFAIALRDGTLAQWHDDLARAAAAAEMVEDRKAGLIRLNREQCPSGRIAASGHLSQ